MMSSTTTPAKLRFKNGGAERSGVYQQVTGEAFYSEAPAGAV
jgi:hypothetical protein